MVLPHYLASPPGEINKQSYQHTAVIKIMQEIVIFLVCTAIYGSKRSESLSFR